MTIDLAAALADARRLWRRDRALLLRLAGPFLFLPAFASLLLLPEAATGPAATPEAAQAAMVAWLVANAHWIAARLAIDLFGVAAVMTLYLDRGHATVGDAIGRAVRLFPAYLFAALLAWGLVLAGLLALIVPGLYIVGRMTMVGPAVVAERRVRPGEAIVRSIELTRGSGWLLLGVVAATLTAGYVVTLLLLRIEDAMIAAHATNPVTVAILDAAAAAVATLATLARALIEVAIYRRLVGRQGI